MLFDLELHAGLIEAPNQLPHLRIRVTEPGMALLPILLRGGGNIDESRQNEAGQGCGHQPPGHTVFPGEEPNPPQSAKKRGLQDHGLEGLKSSGWNWWWSSHEVSN